MISTLYFQLSALILITRSDTSIVHYHIMKTDIREPLREVCVTRRNMTRVSQTEWYRLVTTDARPPVTTTIIDKVTHTEDGVVLLRLFDVPLEPISVGIYWCDNRYYVLWSELSKLTKGKIPDSRIERICLVRTMWVQLTTGSYARRILVMWRQIGNVREEMARVDYKFHQQEVEKQIKLEKGKEFAVRETMLEDNSCDESDNEYDLDGFVVSEDTSDSEINVEDEPRIKYSRVIED